MKPRRMKASISTAAAVLAATNWEPPLVSFCSGTHAATLMLSRVATRTAAHARVVCVANPDKADDGPDDREQPDLHESRKKSL